MLRAGDAAVHASTPRALVQLQRHALDALSAGVILKLKAKLSAHAQHGGVFSQHLPVHARQPDDAGVLDQALHQQPAETMALERGAHDDGEFSAAAIRIEMQPHHAEHLASGLIERDERHRAFVVEMGEFVDTLFG